MTGGAGLQERSAGPLSLVRQESGPAQGAGIRDFLGNGLFQVVGKLGWKSKGRKACSHTLSEECPAAFRQGNHPFYGGKPIAQFTLRSWKAGWQAGVRGRLSRGGHGGDSLSLLAFLLFAFLSRSAALR